MIRVDILIVNALAMELEAVREVLTSNGAKVEDSGTDESLPYLLAKLPSGETEYSLALARPTRMGAVPVATVASTLVERLKPQCLAMSGVCAGNPRVVALGDVIVAELAYTYDEGKRTAQKFEPDHRQVLLEDVWLRQVQDFDVTLLPSYGSPNESEQQMWLLEQLAAKLDPNKHPARQRYLGGDRWEKVVKSLESQKLIVRDGVQFQITKHGRDEVEALRAYSASPPRKLPFAVHPGPIASGNAVVKDGLTWDALRRFGIRTVAGLEMEASAIAQVAHRHQVPHWLVAKGVMDYADPNKEDRMKPFAARASAEVLVRLLQTLPFQIQTTVTSEAYRNVTNLIGNVEGSDIQITQVFSPLRDNDS